MEKLNIIVFIILEAILFCMLCTGLKHFCFYKKPNDKSILKSKGFRAFLAVILSISILFSGPMPMLQAQTTQSTIYKYDVVYTITDEEIAADYGEAIFGAYSDAACTEQVDSEIVDIINGTASWSVQGTKKLYFKIKSLCSTTGPEYIEYGNGKLETNETVVQSIPKPTATPKPSTSSAVSQNSTTVKVNMTYDPKWCMVSDFYDLPSDCYSIYERKEIDNYKTLPGDNGFIYKHDIDHQKVYAYSTVFLKKKGILFTSVGIGNAKFRVRYYTDASKTTKKEIIYDITVTSKKVTESKPKIPKATWNKKVNGLKFYEKTRSKKDPLIAPKITWKKVKNSTGYIIYRQGNASKRWVKIGTTKKNYFKLGQIYKNYKVNIKVVAYKKTKKGKIYSKAGSISVNPKKTFKGYSKIIEKRFWSEIQFLICNKDRKKHGADPLIWSEDLYEIACFASDANYKYGGGHILKKATYTIQGKYIDQSNIKGTMATGYGFNKHYDENLKYAYTLQVILKSGGSSENFTTGDFTCIRNSAGHYAVAISKKYKYSAWGCTKGGSFQLFDTISGYRSCGTKQYDKTTIKFHKK